MEFNDRLSVCVGGLVALGAMVLVGYVVAQLGPIDPWVIGGVLTAVAVVLASIPPIIKALSGKDHEGH